MNEQFTTVYAIAEETNIPYGHGDSYKCLTIQPTGSYKQGPFRPVFREESVAQAYLDSIEFNSKMRVVPVEIL